MKTVQTEVLVIGTGISGCATALYLADAGVQVTMVTRSKQPEDTASWLAQGGIVYRGPTDSPGTLETDILQAGAGLCNPDAVKLLAAEGPELVEKVLIERLGVRFDQDEEGDYSLGEEAAHSSPRILHCGDHTGKEIEKAFLSTLSGFKNVQILTEHTAVDLLTLAHHSLNPRDLYDAPRCVGAYVFDQAKKEVVAVLAKETVLATGGLGQLYLHTTNPVGARGDGLVMAYRTGARVMNLEYIQFHPTALYLKTAERFLISEAVRGEGGRLINHAGEEFMLRHDPRGALAPRDVVSRGIHDELLREGFQFVYLDITHKPADWIRQRFPKIYGECLKRGIDVTKEPIPVVPAAHYSCGGVAVDQNGNTTIQNLWAVGEVSCTGVHGANRLASTSLLEDLVWGVRAAKAIRSEIGQVKDGFPKIREWVSQNEAVDAELLAQDWVTLKHTMWNYVGLVRTRKRLDRAQRILRELSDEVEKFYSDSTLSDELIGLRNGVMAGQLILTAARRNRQSIGCHYLRDEH